MSSEALLVPIGDPLVGKVLAERYRVARKLGEGGMGAVYEGEHLVIKKRVAIKVLHPQFAMDGDVVARFHQEALAATAIGHEHIVEVNDMGRTPDGALFMVLEFLAGRDFADLLERESPLSIGRVAHIVAQVCDAVQAAHDKGIVHRDLKPENVYLVKRGGDPDFVKVLDFGISKMKDETGGSRSQTKTGAIMGTAYYLSPEQAMGKKSVDFRSDIWAMGVILFRALTGRFPFDDEAYPMLIVKICTDAPVRPSAYRSDVPPELEALILRCLDKDAERRPRSCTEIAAALGQFRALTTVLPGTRLSAPSPMPGLRSTSEMRPRGSRNDSPDAFANTMATPADAPVRAMTPGPATVAAAAVPTKPSRIPQILGLVAAVTAIGGGSAWYASRPSEPAPTVIASPEPPPEPAPPEPAPPAESVLLIVSPSDAVALVDGRPVHADASGELHVPVVDDDVALHELRVESRGFRTWVEDLRISYGHRVVVSLDPGSGVDDRRASAGAAPTTGSGHRRGATGVSSERTGAAVAPSSEAAHAEPRTETVAAASAAASTAGPTAEAAAPADPAPAGVVVPPSHSKLRGIPGTH